MHPFISYGFSFLLSFVLAVLTVRLLTYWIEALYDGSPDDLLAYPDREETPAFLSRRNLILAAVVFSSLYFSFSLLQGEKSIVPFLKNWFAIFFVWGIAVTDGEQHVIYNIMVGPFAALGLLFDLIGYGTADMPYITALVAGVILLALCAVSRGLVSAGDVKFLFALALWTGEELFVILFVCGALAIAVTTLILRLMHKDETAPRIPYAPFFAVPGILCCLVA